MGPRATRRTGEVDGGRVSENEVDRSCTVNGRVLLLASVDGDRPTVLRRA